MAESRDHLEPVPDAGDSANWQQELEDGAWPHPANPLSTARRFLEQYEHEGHATLAYWSGSWLMWSVGSWSEVDPKWIANRIWLALEDAWYWEGLEDPRPKDWNPSTAKIRDVINALTAVTELPTDLQPGDWMDGRETSGRYIAMKNGILDMRSRELLAHTPQFFSLSRLPFDFQPDAPPPGEFFRFVHSLWPDDQASIDLLQEVFGWAVSNRTDLEKIIMFLGPTRAGKGVMTRLISRVVGQDNVAGMTLASFGEQFGLSTLIGKSLAIVNDARLGRSNPERVIERLLTISGNGDLPIDVKYRQPRTMQLQTRLIIVSNELPRFIDASRAIADRMVFVIMRHSFSGREDLGLFDRLKPELPSIFNWALEGQDRLEAMGSFTVTDAAHEIADQMRELSSPVAFFVEEMCELGEDLVEVKDSLYAAYMSWAARQNQKPLEKSVFMRNLLASTSAERTRPRDGEQRVQAVRGLRLRSRPFTASHPAVDE